MDEVLVKANHNVLDFKAGECGWLARTPMIDGMIQRGYLSVLECRQDTPAQAVDNSVDNVPDDPDE